MKIILFGATGMVGQGVLRECLLDAEVESVLSIGRTACGQRDEKLSERVESDLFCLNADESRLAGYDACFFCLGVSSLGMKEGDYRRITFDLTVFVATLLARLNPSMTFIYVSGTGTDSSERGSQMWARIKGATENALFRLPFKAAYAFRPGYIQPMHGVVAKTGWVRFFYALFAPMYPLWQALAPGMVTTTERMGRAMLRAAKQGASNRVLEARDINILGA